MDYTLPAVTMRVCSACQAAKADYCYLSRQAVRCVACTGSTSSARTERIRIRKRLRANKVYRDRLQPILDEAKRLERQGQKYIHLTIPEFLRVTEGLRDLQIDLS